MSKTEPKVSAIIPSYNRFKYLINAVDSILNQDYKNLEIIIINDGSDELQKGIEYTFIGNNSSHPFRMYITDSSGTTTDLVNGLSLRGSQSFTLDPNVDYSDYTKTYVCNSHSSMAGTFNIIPETSNYALLLGVLTLGIVALRRR